MSEVVISRYDKPRFVTIIPQDIIVRETAQACKEAFLSVTKKAIDVRGNLRLNSSSADAQVAFSQLWKLDLDAART